MHSRMTQYILIRIVLTTDNMKRQELDKNDSGIKSEGEDDSQTGTVKPKATLGKTPNHLTLR